MTAERLVEAYETVTMTEVTLPDGKTTVSRAYSVRDRADPTSVQSFEDMGSADTYFEQLALRRQPP